jgi:hypothetical protein
MKSHTAIFYGCKKNHFSEEIMKRTPRKRIFAAILAGVAAVSALSAESADLFWSGAQILTPSGADNDGGIKISGGFSYREIWNGAEITGYIGEDTDIVIPPEIEGIPVTTVAHNAFLGFTSLTGVTVSEGVSEIGAGAFANCSLLTSVVFDGNVSVGNSAFLNCTSLKSVVCVGSVCAGAEPGCRCPTLKTADAA